MRYFGVCGRSYRRTNTAVLFPYEEKLTILSISAISPAIKLFSSSEIKFRDALVSDRLSAEGATR